MPLLPQTTTIITKPTDQQREGKVKGWRKSGSREGRNKREIITYAKYHYF